MTQKVEKNKPMSLKNIAKQLKSDNKTVELIYAFNGVGKTRLSLEFKKLIDDESEEDDKPEENDENEDKPKILYYNAFTEDLFYWDNTKLILKIQPNSFTEFILEDEGKENDIIKYFHRLSTNKMINQITGEITHNITPAFNPEFSEVTFNYASGGDNSQNNIKISKGEESCFIWSIFYSLLAQAIEILNEKNSSTQEDTKDKSTAKTINFDELEYVFIDDPVSSLDDNHLIELAVDLAALIKSSKSNLKFIITTHNPLFYNVLHNELENKLCYMLNKFEDGTYELAEKKGDSNRSFSYHLFLRQTIQKAIDNNTIQKYHFTLLRNLYEKTASFLGYRHWGDLLPDDKTVYHKRIINFTSHSTLSNEVVSEPTEPEKQTVKFLLNHLVDNYGFFKENNGEISNHK